MSDCISVFTFLNSLARFHNASAHVLGGRQGAALFLNPKHSDIIASDWGTYFDTNANQGNPFYPVDEQMKCKRVLDPLTDWYRIFDDGVNCVNIVKSIFTFDRAHTNLFHNNRDKPLLSANVKGLAERALHGIPPNFGCLHVRRCERMTRNLEECTDPAAVHALVKRKSAAANASVNTWLVFTYVEARYLPAMKKEFSKASGLRFVYEEDLFAGLPVEGDNYLLYGALLHLLHRASAVIDLKDERWCTASYALDSVQGASVATDNGSWELRGTCGKQALGKYTPRPL